MPFNFILGSEIFLPPPPLLESAAKRVGGPVRFNGRVVPTDNQRPFGLV